MRALAERSALLAVTGALVAGAHALWPDPAVRAERLYVGVLTLGYGHLLGALWLGWPRLRAKGPSGVPGPAFGLWLACGVLVALSAWSVAVSHAPWLVVGLLGLSTWHTVENDLALFRGGRLAAAIPPRERDPARRALALAWTFGFGVLVTATPTWQEAFVPVVGTWGGAPLRILALAAAAVAVARGTGAVRAGAAIPVGVALAPAPSLALVDLFALSTLHHLISWLAVLALRVVREVRGGARSRAARVAGRVALVHALPAAACLGSLLAASGPLADARRWLLDPGLYLFLASLHVLQSAWIRPVSPRALEDERCDAPPIRASDVPSAPRWRSRWPFWAARPRTASPHPHRASPSTRSAVRSRSRAAG